MKKTKTKTKKLWPVLWRVKGHPEWYVLEHYRTRRKARTTAAVESTWYAEREHIIRSVSVEVALACPNCGEPLIPPSGRGLHDDDGNYIEHREACRCLHCGPMWFDDAPPVTCACGVTARVVVVDEEHVHAEEVEP